MAAPPRSRTNRSTNRPARIGLGVAKGAFPREGARFCGVLSQKSYAFLCRSWQFPIFPHPTGAKALAHSLELCKCAGVRAAPLSYLTRRPALRGQRARWSGWPALHERKRIGGVETVGSISLQAEPNGRVCENRSGAYIKYESTGSGADPGLQAGIKRKTTTGPNLSGHLDAAPLPKHG
jgi:hypothetical protein